MSGRLWVAALAASAVAGAQEGEFAPTVTVETARTEFHVAPLSSQGDARTQARRAAEQLWRAVGDGEVVKVRAFVRSAGDAAAVRAALAGRRKGKTPLALTLVEVGGLPRAEARVALEGVAVSRRSLNPGGLLFVSGQAASASPEKPVGMVELNRRALADIKSVLAGSGLAPGDVVRATAYLSSWDQFAEVRSEVERFFGPAPLPTTFAQIHNRPGRAVIEIETVARLKGAAAGAAAVEFLNPDAPRRSPNFTQAVAVRSRRMVLTGGFLATADAPAAYESQTHETFRRMSAALESAGASVKRVAFSSLFPVSDEVSAVIRKVRTEYYDRTSPPGSTMLPFQGAGAAGGIFVVETIAPLPD